MGFWSKIFGSASESRIKEKRLNLRLHRISEAKSKELEIAQEFFTELANRFGFHTEIGEESLSSYRYDFNDQERGVYSYSFRYHLGFDIEENDKGQRLLHRIFIDCDCVLSRTDTDEDNPPEVRSEDEVTVSAAIKDFRKKYEAVLLELSSPRKNDAI